MTSPQHSTHKPRLTCTLLAWTACLQPPSIRPGTEPSRPRFEDTQMSIYTTSLITTVLVSPRNTSNLLRAAASFVSVRRKSIGVTGVFDKYSDRLGLAIPPFGPSSTLTPCPIPTSVMSKPWTKTQLLPKTLLWTRMLKLTDPNLNGRLRSGLLLEPSQR